MVIDGNGGLVKKRNQGFILEQTKWLLAALLRWGILGKKCVREREVGERVLLQRLCLRPH